ncbi:A disintegrin and metalloproteinase with thrombospondin motifs adt-1-like [Uloborus diversus]|uniref:A disintegrin and metalloproteinase with thrombospondin motifs adt-1-like n=1 Tax=Uloborus diversus TaxID=327109 RepID=UPI0024099F27|nr:A disintegrin and metalloproteinase with thrombospondin motifs adt-1-like [Uloborus diversus]
MRWMLAAILLWIFQDHCQCYPSMQFPIFESDDQEYDAQEIVYPKLITPVSLHETILKSNETPVAVIKTLKHTFYIKLQPNSDLLRQNTASRNSSTNGSCHYYGTVLSHHQGRAALSMCGSGLKMSGVIMLENDTYVVRPLEGDKSTFPGSHANSTYADNAHVLRKMETPTASHCGVNHENVLNHGDENYLSKKEMRFRRSETSARKTIEIAVFVDNKLYDKFIEERKQPVSQLKDTVLAILNEVELIYNYQSLKTKFKLVVVKLEILAFSKDTPDPADGNIDVYLDNFCLWQSTKNPPESSSQHWDHAIMMTGYDLHKVIHGNEKNPKVLGLAWVSGMCRPKHSCTLNEGSSFEAAFVIAHEMGHSLGMMHDGRGNNCDPSAFLMAEKTGPGRTTWSSCSNDYLDKFFERGRGHCLEEDNSFALPDADEKFTEKLPGQRFNLEYQCKLSLGEEFKPHIVPKAPFNNVCRELWCVSGLWASVAHPALEGSTCGQGKQCIQGACTVVAKSAALASNKEVVDDMKSAVAEFLEKLSKSFHLLLS